MIKKWMYLFFVAHLMAAMVIPASGAEGSIRVNTDAERVSLYCVGWPEGRGYRLKASCGGGYLIFDDILSPDLAAWLQSRVQKEDMLLPQGTDSSFGNLTEGLYLVCDPEGVAFPPFLVSIPWDGYHWQLEVEPSSEPVPQTGDSLAIVIFAMAASGAGIMLFGRRRKMC